MRLARTFTIIMAEMISFLSTFSELSSGENYFWIDDIHVTGSLASKLPKMKYFKWNNNFLTDHVQYKEAFLEGQMFHPEIMVASDLEAPQILHISAKFAKCHEMKCYDQIYSKPENVAILRPPCVELGRKSSQKKSEL